MSHESSPRPVTHSRMRRFASCVDSRRVCGLLTAGLLSVMSGCDPDPDPMTQPTMDGELQRGEFVYRCAGSNDAFCADFQARRFPERFAVGGSFEVAFESSASLGGAPTIDSSAPTLLEPLQTSAVSRFVFRQPGRGALMAISGDEVVDFLHITSERVLSYDFSDDRGRDGLSEVTLEPGESITLAVQPRGERGQVLAGTLAYAWSTDEPDIARMASDTDGRSAQLRAVSPGTTRLFVEGVDLVGSIQVVVTEVSAGSTGTEGTGTGTETSSDGNTETDTHGGTEGDSGSSSTTAAGTDGGSDSTGGAE